MKTTLKFAAIGLIVFATTAKALPFAPHTNLVQNIGIKVIVYSEGDVTTNGTVATKPVIKQIKTTKDIIQLLGDATTNTFSASAKLQLITSLTFGGDPTILVVDGTNQVNVTGFFSYDDTSFDHIEGGTLNTVSGVEKGIDYSFIRFRLRDDGATTIKVHFDTDGFATTKSSSLVKNGAIIGDAHQTTANLAGGGEVSDSGELHSIIVQVTLTVTGTTVQEFTNP